MAGFLNEKTRRKVNRLFELSLMSHNIDFKTFKVNQKDG